MKVYKSIPKGFNKFATGSREFIEKALLKFYAGTSLTWVEDADKFRLVKENGNAVGCFVIRYKNGFAFGNFES